MDDSDSFALACRLARQAQRRARRNRARRARTPPRAPRPAAAPPARSPAQRSGARGEDAALELLRAAGLALLGRNLRCRAGEIDLAMRDGAELVFVEVRRRAGMRYGGAAASVDAAKRRRLLRAAAHFLAPLARAHWGGATPRCRFDVVALEAGGARWLKDAFRAG